MEICSGISILYTLTYMQRYQPHMLNHTLSVQKAKSEVCCWFGVCCWFLSCLQGFSPGFPAFLPPKKKTNRNSG